MPRRFFLLAVTSAWSFLLLSLPCVSAPTVLAQEALSGMERVRQAEAETGDRRETDEPPRTQPRPRSSESEAEITVPMPLTQVFVREIRVSGSTVFSPDELAQVATPYVNRVITTEDLEELRQKLTAMYTDRGYVNSGAFVPDQDVTDGVVQIMLVEGILSDIQLTGVKRFWPFYLKQRIMLAADPPLNVNTLRERLQLLLQDERIARLNSELKPGLRTGEAILEVEVEEARPYHFYLEGNNFQSPTIGADRGLGTVIHQNLLGLGDAFSFTYGRSAGLDLLVETDYTLPVTPWDTTLSVGYQKNDFSVIEDPFDPLNIESTTEIFTFSVRHPVYRTMRDEVALSVTGEYSTNKLTIFETDEPLEIFRVTGPDGATNVAALRFGQEWIHREPAQIIALRSRFSFGLDVLDATVSGQGADQPDSQFFVWLGQAQWVRQFGQAGFQVQSRMDLQVANDPLFPVEQFPVGGRFTVRGYRENTLVRDNAFVFSIESRAPLFRTAHDELIMQLAPFVDVGRAWFAGENPPGVETKTLGSVGIGLRVSLLQQGQFNVYWGQQLNHVPDRNNTLQDNGIHWDMVWQVF